MTDNLVTLLLDKSGSMAACHEATIEAVNTYLDGLKKATRTLFSLVQFDTVGLERTCVRTPIAKAPRLNHFNYMPRGGTPLVDAAVKTIHAVEASLSEFAFKPKVVVAIQTDGHENSSTEYVMGDLHQLIKEKMAEGWQFLFMGCGIDAYDQARYMGISTCDTMAYNPTAESSNAAFAASASNTVAYLSGVQGNVSYTTAQRQAAGDKHWDTASVGKVQPDAAGPTKAHVQYRSKQKKSLIDDVTL